MISSQRALGAAAFGLVLLAGTLLATAPAQAQSTPAASLATVVCVSAGERTAALSGRHLGRDRAAARHRQRPLPARQELGLRRPGRLGHARAAAASSCSASRRVSPRPAPPARRQPRRPLPTAPRRREPDAPPLAEAADAHGGGSPDRGRGREGRDGDGGAQADRADRDLERLRAGHRLPARAHQAG